MHRRWSAACVYVGAAAVETTRGTIVRGEAGLVTNCCTRAGEERRKRRRFASFYHLDSIAYIRSTASRGV